MEEVNSSGRFHLDFNRNGGSSLLEGCAVEADRVAHENGGDELNLSHDLCDVLFWSDGAGMLCSSQVDQAQDVASEDAAERIRVSGHHDGANGGFSRRVICHSCVVKKYSLPLSEKR